MLTKENFEQLKKDLERCNINRFIVVVVRIIVVVIIVAVVTVVVRKLLL